MIKPHIITTDATLNYQSQLEKGKIDVSNKNRTLSPVTATRGNQAKTQLAIQT